MVDGGPAPVRAGIAAMITAVVLAAGTSSRLGRPKPLLPLGDRPLLAHVLASVRGSTAGQVVVVLGHEEARVRREVSLDGATVVRNPDYAEGMSTSIRSGIRAADPAADGYLIVLADQPFVSPQTIDELIRRKETSDAKIVIPTYGGVRANPVLLDRSLAAEASAIAGDVGCRAIFGDHEGEILEVPVSDPGVVVDVDTEEEARRADAVATGREPLAAVAAEIVAARVRSHRYHARTAREPIRDRPDLEALAASLRSAEEPFALATIVRAVRPTSGKQGAKAIVRANREIVGFVGGSCAESAVVAESLKAIADGRPRLLRLSRDAGSAPPGEGVVEYVMECHSGGAMDIYIEPNVPKARLVLVGDSPVVDTLAAMGRLLGYRVVVVAPGLAADAVPEADEVHADLAALGDAVTSDTYAVVATMGKYDESALRALAPSAARYVGLVASRKRAAAVREGLTRDGLGEDAIARIRNPAGVDIAAHTPEEIALSILAEITRARRTATPPPPAAATRVPREPILDPVCGMEVDPSTPLVATHGGTTYRFCSDGCRTRFLAAPEGFLAQASGDL